MLQKNPDVDKNQQVSWCSVHLTEKSDQVHAELLHLLCLEPRSWRNSSLFLLLSFPLWFPHGWTSRPFFCPKLSVLLPEPRDPYPLCGGSPSTDRLGSGPLAAAVATHMEVIPVATAFLGMTARSLSLLEQQLSRCRSLSPPQTSSHCLFPSYSLFPSRHHLLPICISPSLLSHHRTLLPPQPSQQILS